VTKGMAKVERVSLGAVADIERCIVEPSEITRDELCLSLEDLDAESGVVRMNGVRDLPKSSKFRFSANHVLYGKLRPYLRKVVRPDISGVCSTDILPIRAGNRLNRDYLFHFLRTPHFTSRATSAAVGVNLPRLSPATLSTFDIPLPPLLEQRRIAEILDKADTLRAKRRAALAQLDTLTQSIFLDMFGDPTTNPKRWPMHALGAVICAVTNGITRRRSESDTGESIVLRLRDIRSGWIDLIDVNRITLTSDEARRFEIVAGIFSSSE
jgi:type I restriction enzyme, S subunit